MGEHEAGDDHRRRDRQGEEPVDRERQPVVEQEALASSRVRRSDASRHRTRRTNRTGNRATSGVAGVTNSLPSDGPSATLSRHGDDRAAHRAGDSVLTLTERAAEQGPGADGPGARRATPRCCASRSGRRLRRVRVRARLRPRRRRGRPRARVPRRQGRRRSVQRSVPQGRRRSTSSSRSRSPGSRSRTRTPPARAAAARSFQVAEGEAPDGRGRAAAARHYETRLARVSVPLRVAVVGSGPAGFYAADALLKSEDPPVEVDLIERLPTPWGLVRLGVAPDHENIKAVSRAFEKTAARPTASASSATSTSASTSRTTSCSALRRGRLHGRRADRPAARDPGRGSPGLVAGHRVRRLVQRPPRLPGSRLRPLARARGRVGNGNVAIDGARMLALTAQELASTDTIAAAEQAIVDSGIREIVMLGRRGPVQAAFTPPELQELGELAGADVVVDPRRSRARRRERRGARGRPRARAPQRRPAARVRRARAEGQAAADRAPLPRLAGRDPGRRARRGGRARAQRARRRTRAARRACRPRSAR